MPEASQAPDRPLPPAIRARLDEFLQRIDRLRVEDLPMFATRPLDPVGHDEAVNAALRAAFETGRRRLLDDAQRAVADWVGRLYNRQLAYPEWMGPSMGRSVGSAADRARLRASLVDVVTAIVLADVLDEVYQDHLIGPWAALLGDDG